MYPADSFLPSSTVRRQTYDEEGRLREVRIGPDGSHSQLGGVGEYNSMYSSTAEAFGEIAPFLKAARLRDAKRRNYIIQPGGACIYFESEPPMEDPWANGRVQFNAPSDQETFGHNSLDGSKMGNPNGRPFTVAGGRGSSSGG